MAGRGDARPGRKRRAIPPKLEAIVGGAIAAAAHFVPILALPLLLLGVFALLRAVEREPRYRLGFLWSLAYFAPLALWLGQFVSRWVGGWVFGTFIWLLVTVLLALPLALIAPIAGRAFAANRAWTIPLAWIALELFRSYVPVFAFPWGLLAHPLAGFVALFNIAPFVGEFGVSGLVVATATVLLRWPGLTRRKRLVAGGVTAAILAVGSINRSLTPRTLPFSLAAYQPGFDLAYANPPVDATTVRLAIAAARTEQERLGADLLVLPEGLVSVRTPADLPELSGAGALVTGGQRHVGETAYQTAFAFDGGNQKGGWKWADKTRLVIFGEFVPGRGVIPYPESFHLPGGDLAAGERVTGFDLRGQDGRRLKIGPVLCFEALFPDIAYRQKLAGAEALAVMSLDDWFADTAAPAWLAESARWRALETRRPVVRVGTMGLTRIYDAAGEEQGSLKWGKTGVLMWDGRAR